MIAVTLGISEAGAAAVLAGQEQADKAVAEGGELVRVDEGPDQRRGIVSGIRGAYLYDDILPEFDGGKVTISIINFLRHTFHKYKSVMNDQPVPPNGQVSLWIKEARIPDAVLKRAKH